MNINECRSCRAPKTIFLMNGNLLKKEIAYYECPICNYVQTEFPYWLDKAYKNPIDASDTGILWRNQYNAKIVLGVLFMLGKMQGTVVDWAGGYGILVRQLRDYGVNAYWSDIYSENLLAKGFEYEEGPVELITAFEAFEHFVYPQDELDKMLSITSNLLLSTELIPNPAPTQNNWWYYGKEHGQHIGFFRLETLERMAKKHGKYLASDGKSYHLITSKRINSNYWKFIRRITNLHTKIILRGLKSKTWDDHIIMTKKNENCF